MMIKDDYEIGGPTLRSRLSKNELNVSPSSTASSTSSTSEARRSTSMAMYLSHRTPQCLTDDRYIAIVGREFIREAFSAEAKKDGEDIINGESARWSLAYDSHRRCFL